MSTKTKHQATELANAFRDIITLEDAKAKLEVMAILRRVADNEITPLAACTLLAEWAGK
jgi:hypothetical protein